jgi:hypothetical protein
VPAPKEEGIPGEESAPRSRSGFCPAESGAAPCLPQGNLQRVLAYSRQTPRSLSGIDSPGAPNIIVFPEGTSA